MAAIPRIRVLPAPVGITGEVVVVIDVIRAFTSAAAAFASGAERILCVEDVAAAHRLRAAHPDAVLMGEVRGLRPDGFDLGNSPTEPTRSLVAGRTIVQRTSNGTRGLVAAAHARHLAAATVNNVGATARWIQRLAPVSVDLVATGSTSEDLACAEHLAALLRGGSPSAEALEARVWAAGTEHEAMWTRDRDQHERDEFMADMERCATVDRFDFVMPARTIDSTTVELRAVGQR